MSVISILRQGKTLCAQSGEGRVDLRYEGEYLPGDVIEFESDFEYAILSVDQTILPARVYLPKKRYVYPLPLDGDNPLVYVPGAFRQSPHILSIREDTGRVYRNLALNPADSRAETLGFPHITANVETRNESVFAARNVIDGLCAANGHGVWPYESWGIGARTDAQITLEFGRAVRVDSMALHLRADFPHDAWWIQGTVVLSDGFEKTFPLQKLEGPQKIDLGEHTVTWMRLERLIKCDMPSAFPSLRQWEVYGCEIE